MRYEVLDTIVDVGDDEAITIRAKYLSNYIYLQEVVEDLDEETALKALCLELSGKNREQIVSRLHGVYNKFRRKREREIVGLD